MENLRDQIALKAMEILLAEIIASTGTTQEGWTDALAKISYAIADAMLEAKAMSKTQ